MNPAAIEKRIEALEQITLPPVVVITEHGQSEEDAISEYERLNGKIGNRPVVVVLYHTFPGPRYDRNNLITAGNHTDDSTHEGDI